MGHTLEAVLRESEKQHRHICPRQVLGARMGLLAGSILGVSLPQRRKKLMVFVETDGCFADGIVAATGCTLGHRTMRLIDIGRVAATFVDIKTKRAVRIAPSATSRQDAINLIENPRSRWHAYLEAYQIIPDDQLFDVTPVRLSFSLDDLLSKPSARTLCESCGEEIINEREVIRDGETLCRACANGAYYTTNTSDTCDLPNIALPFQYQT